MLSIIAVVISIVSIVFAVAVIKKLDDIDTHLKELLAAREDGETPR
ncbi:chemotaxis protein [Corynebacterium sp. KPL4015]